jgi:NTE family protein
VLRTLEEEGVAPDIVCGTSIGSLVGAAYAAGELDRLEHWTRALTWRGVLKLLDLSMSGGLIKGARLIELFRPSFQDRAVQSLARTYGAVATELNSGREVWLTEGQILDVIRASFSLPGLFTPARLDGKLLVDGGLVNPVPVTLARALGADLVVAVDLNADLVGQYQKVRTRVPRAPPKPKSDMLKRVRASLPRFLSSRSEETDAPPSVMDVLAASINVMQVRITRSRLAGEPADVMITPRLAHLALMDFHRAKDAIEEGARAARLALPQIREALSGLASHERTDGVNGDTPR